MGKILELDHQSPLPITGQTTEMAPRTYYARGGQMREGVTTNDVLLVPRVTPEKGVPEIFGPGIIRIIPDDAFNDPEFANRDLSSRSKVKTGITLGPNQEIRLNVPIFSSPMVDVTETDLAIALAQAGGMPIIHRANTIEEETQIIKNVRDAMGYVFEKPPTLPKSATLYDARQKMNESHRGLVVITNENGKVEGVITTRDAKKDLAPQDMTIGKALKLKPRKDVVTIFEDIDTSSVPDLWVIDRITNKKILAKDLMWKERLEKLIITDNRGHLKGAITDHDRRMFSEFPYAAIDNEGKLIVGAAIGIKGQYMKRAKSAVEAGAKMLTIDVANAYIKEVRTAITNLKKEFPGILIMAGSVATRQGVKKLAEAGADLIRCNIGSGSICITRGVSGFGYPGLSAILECADEGDTHNIPVIADGGIWDSSEIAKYIASGALGVMLGRRLAATEEAPGQLIVDPDTKVRSHEYRGMASDAVRVLLEKGEGYFAQSNKKRPEGIPTKVTIIGTVKEVIEDLMNGLKSGLTYGGVANLEQLRNETEIIKVTSSAALESGAR